LNVDGKNERILINSVADILVDNEDLIIEDNDRNLRVDKMRGTCLLNELLANEKKVENNNNNNNNNNGNNNNNIDESDKWKKNKMFE
jgi:hypothetical protein